MSNNIRSASGGKKFLPILLLVVLILTGCGKDKPPADQPQESESLSGSMIDLLAINKSLKCSFSVEIDNTSLSGTTYVADNKVRSDFSAGINGEDPLTSHMISDGEILYAWSDQIPGQGIMANINEVSETDDKGYSEFVSKSFSNYRTKYDYKCSDWQVEENMFKNPEGFEFVDFEELIKQSTAPAPVYRPRSVINYAKECAACAEIMHYSTRLSCEQRYGC
jgi:hypothetical protein